MARVLQEQPMNSFKEASNFLKTRINYKAAGIRIRKTISNQKTQLRQTSTEEVEQPSSDQPYREESQINPERLRQNCSRFMKGCIDKLKRQRKREKRKISLSNQKQSSLPSKIRALPAIQCEKRESNLLKQVSSSRLPSNLFKHSPSGLNINTDYLYETIRQIKQQRKKAENAKATIKRKTTQVFPQIGRKQGRSSKPLCCEKLDPWEAETQIQPQYNIFECY